MDGGPPVTGRASSLLIAGGYSGLTALSRMTTHGCVLSNPTMRSCCRRRRPRMNAVALIITLCCCVAQGSEVGVDGDDLWRCGGGTAVVWVCVLWVVEVWQAR